MREEIVAFFSQFIHEFQLPLKSPVLIFSLVLFIILLAPIVLRKLNLPGIIGLIISGVIIGPHGLYILEQNSAVNLFSTIGLLYIMFIAGLELDLQEFKANKNKSILFGFFTFIIPLAIGFPVVYYILGYDINASFLTASMFATHTLVAYPIVSKFGIAKNQAVAVTVGGTILTDTAVLIILAVIMGNSQGSLNQAFWIKLGISLVVFVFIMFFIIPKIAKWFFAKLENEKHAHYIFVLAVVFFAAFLAEVAGVEAIIGAFVAGLALNKLIPHSSALMNRIEFIGNALFIPFFLISVGMIVDVSVIVSGPMAIIIAIVLTIVAISSKWLAAFFTQKVFKYSGAQRQLIFGLSSAHAAATLAVIMVGHKAGIIDENILNGTIILILITCVVASFAAEKAAKKIVIENEEDTTTLKTQSKKISNEHLLLPIENLKNMDKLLEFSIFIKDKKSSQPISVLTVVSNNEDASQNLNKAKEKLHEVVKQASASETPIQMLTQVDFSAISGIAHVSKKTASDIVILEWPQRVSFLDKLLLGKKVENIIDIIERNIYFCELKKPLVSFKKIVLVAVPLAEHELGFEMWVQKVAKLSQELSMPIHFYCSENTKAAIEEVFKRNNLSATFTMKIFKDWDNYLILSKQVQEQDLFILIAARKGTASYFAMLDNVPNKLDKYLSKNSKILIYPRQYASSPVFEGIEDANAETLNIGLEAIQKIGRGIGKIFKREEEK